MDERTDPRGCGNSSLMTRPALRRPALLLSCIALLLAFAPLAGADAPPNFDLVLENGRVMDPASGLDAERHVGIRDGRIAAVSETPLVGGTTIDARGLVVAPGFIDLHTHSPTPLGQHYQLLDGVTTALELEAGVHPAAAAGEFLTEGARIHYGASTSWASIRAEVKMGVRQPSILLSKPSLIGFRGAWTAVRSLFGTPDDVFVKKASPGDRERMRERIVADLRSGGLGIGIPLDYFSEAVDEYELRMIFRVAADENSLIFIHLRRGVNGDPAGLREALGMANETGAAIHICHIQHNAMGNIDLFLEEIRNARAAGVDVTTEMLPYNAGSALISSAVFGRDWRTIFDIDYGDVEWAATGMRFDESTWNEYRENFPGGQVIHHYVDEAWTRRALSEPGVLVVSDLLPIIDESSKVAPHNGAFARVLGRMARDGQVISLETALTKMTSGPAARMETFFPVFAGKGRVQVGADADLTLFDPEQVIDRATYAEPLQASAGIHTVIVAGRIAVAEGAVVEDTFAGELILDEVLEN
jgi:hypothetical protein